MGPASGGSGGPSRAPPILVSVGYMDPGNWGTDLQGGAQFKFGLLWVVGLASLMAIFMQVIAARLGVVTGKDLAQCCRDWFPRWTRWPNWLLCEIAIGACDLAEVLGSAVVLNLVFRIPLLWAVMITGLDVLLLLGLQRFGMRSIEAIVLLLVATISVCYFIEIFVLPQTKPSFAEMGLALVSPNFRQSGMLYLAVAIVGATVMPHNLYLHSALVQSRKLGKDPRSIGRAIRFNTIDSVVALTIAFFVNAAIMVLAAIVFYHKESVTLPGWQVVPFKPDSDWICIAYLTLAPLLGVGLASTLYAVALFASGQSSTITGTLAGQVVMEGFMHWRIAPWTRRLITRTLAIVPAVLVIGLRGNSSVTDLLIQPVRLGDSTAPGHVPALAFCLLPQENGNMETGLVPARRRLGQCPADYRHGHLRFAGFMAAGAARPFRRMMARHQRRKWLCTRKSS